MHWGMSTPAALEAVRRHAPLVSCITNAVVTHITANVLQVLHLKGVQGVEEGWWEGSGAG